MGWAGPRARVTSGLATLPLAQPASASWPPPSSTQASGLSTSTCSVPSDAQPGARGAQKRPWAAPRQPCLLPSPDTAISPPRPSRSPCIRKRVQHLLAMLLCHCLQGTVASCAAAALLVLHPSPALAAETSASKAVEAAYEQEATVQESKSMLEFMLQQQENAKRAALLSQ